jgi:hypothetical protein
MADGYGHEPHLSPMVLKGRNKGGLLRGLVGDFGVESEVSAETELDHEE